MINSLLRINGITKKYGPNTVLNDVSFDIGKNEVVGLLVDNGAGKSTLVKIMSGVVQATEGEFFWDNKKIPDMNRDVTESLGIETIFQDSALVPQLTISRNIFMGREIANRFGFMKIKEMDQIAADVLDSVITIEGIKSPKQLVQSLSGGQSQAVAIARAVHFKRSLLILD